MKAILALVGVLAGTAVVRAEVLTLRDGDRITGRILSETPRNVRVETPYGRLIIPRKKIATIVRADGKEEVLNPTDTPTSAPPTPPPEQKARIVFVITGATFWQAWNPREAPPDPSLRLEVRLDEDTIATVTDSRLDPEDMPGAVVNSFPSAPEELRVAGSVHSEAFPPEVRPGRIVLKVDVKGGAGDNRRLRVAYQVNAGTAAQPAWRDAAESAVAVVLRTDVPRFVQMRQDRGRMEYSGRRMKYAETFRIELSPE